MDIEVRDLHKSFGTKEVLKGLSFTARGGEAFGLLGRNGAGKTTTIRIMMGVFPSDGGTVLADGQPIDYRKVGFGYLPEERGLYPKREITEQLVYFARLKGLTRDAAAREVARWLDRLEMGEYAKKKLEVLSKGNQQKIQLITAVAHDPDVIILDEPFSGLDPVNAMLLKDVVREEIDRGKAVIFSSHQMSYVEEFCHSVCILNGGVAAVSGNLMEIKRAQRASKLRVRGECAGQLADMFGGTAQEDCVILNYDSEDGRLELMKAAARLGADEISVVEPTLNDIFVAATSEGV